MNQNTPSVEKFSHIFPYMENILQFGTYCYTFATKELTWSNGMFHILGIKSPMAPPAVSLFLKYIHREDTLQVVNEVRESFEQKQPYRLEFSITNEQGIFKRIYAENFIKFNDQGDVLEYCGIVKDITENYRFKKALEQKIEQLDRSNSSLQEFVYVASHDLQEPLRKISTFTERIDAKYKEALGEEGRSYLKRVLASTGNMQTLLEDLLDFSKLSFGEKKFEKVNLQQCINGVISDLELKIEESKTVVNCGESPDIEAFPSQIRQLFSNLINNSIKFKKEHEAPLITIACDSVNHKDYPQFPLLENKDYVRITVEDNGIGFDEEFSERIFKIFQRLHGKAEYKGSGIGLAICKKIVDNHHGFIFANSRLNEGSNFTILLPQTQS
jgi:signal transduction histidine kinase